MGNASDLRRRFLPVVCACFALVAANAQSARTNNVGEPSVEAIEKEWQALQSRNLSAAARNEQLFTLAWKGYTAGHYAKALELANVIGDSSANPATRANALERLARKAQMYGLKDDAISLLNKARLILTQPGDTRSPHPPASPLQTLQLLTICNSLADLYAQTGNLSAAEITRVFAISEASKTMAGAPGSNSHRAYASTIVNGLAVSQLNLARDLVRQGKTAEALIAFDVLFATYPDYCFRDGQIVHLAYERIAAQRYAKNSPERLAMLEEVWAETKYHQFPAIIGTGSLIAAIYEETGNPKLEGFLKQLLDETEAFRAKIPRAKWENNYLVNTHELNLVRYATVLQSKRKSTAVEIILKELKSEYANRFGGDFAKQKAQEIQAQSRRRYRHLVAILIVAAIIGSFIVLAKHLVLSKQTARE